MCGSYLAVFWDTPERVEPAHGWYSVTLHDPNNVGTFPPFPDNVVGVLGGQLGDQWTVEKQVVGNRDLELDIGSSGFRADEIVLPAIATYFGELRQHPSCLR
jgi:hypothetical protein